MEFVDGGALPLMSTTSDSRSQPVAPNSDPVGSSSSSDSNETAIGLALGPDIKMKIRLINIRLINIGLISIRLINITLIK